MELTEKIETINRQLEDNFGIDTLTGRPMWRVVWSEDQYENRLGEYEDFSEAGIYLRTVTEVRYVKKYPWIKEKYVLEQLVLIPSINERELPGIKMSYEPMFPFMTNSGAYAPPTILACRFIINNFLARLGKKAPVEKDVYDGMNKEEYFEAKDAEIKELIADLFGNETDTGDALAHHEAIVVPRNYQKES